MPEAPGGVQDGGVRDRPAQKDAGPQLLRIFEIKPAYDQNIMKQDLYDVTTRVLTGMRDVLKEEK